MQAVHDTAYTNFLGSITNDSTAVVYRNSLKVYMKHLGIAEHAKLLEGTDIYIEDCIKGFIKSERERKVSSSLIQTRMAAIKLFYEVNRRPLAWRLITRTIGRTKKLKDRAYSYEEINKLVGAATYRDKAAILLMCSAGMRIGALPHLTIGNLTPIEKYGIYMITVYEGHDEEYYTFCTPECRQAIDNYLDHRQRLGEKLQKTSPLFRKEFDQRREDSPIMPVTVATLTISLNRVIEKAGIRPKVRLIEGQKSAQVRHEVKALHGFRKFFDTYATKAGVAPLYVEMLMGHDTKLKESYFRPTEKDLLEGNDRMCGYVDAIDYLTINEEQRQKIQIKQLTDENTYFRNTIPQIEDALKQVEEWRKQGLLPPS